MNIEAAYEHVNEENRALTAEVERLRSENEALQQVASGNDERGNLLAAKYGGKPYDEKRLQVLHEMVKEAFPVLTASELLVMDNIAFRGRVAALEAALRHLDAELIKVDCESRGGMQHNGPRARFTQLSPSSRKWLARMIADALADPAS